MPPPPVRSAAAAAKSAAQSPPQALQCLFLNAAHPTPVGSRGRRKATKVTPNACLLLPKPVHDRDRKLQ